MNESLEFILRYVVPGCTFVDIGAHQGEWTIAFAKHGATVLAVEPDDQNMYALRRNLRENGLERVRTWLNAISGTNGSATLHRSDISTLHSLDPQWHEKHFPEYDMAVPTLVQTLTWKSLCNYAGLDSVDILKIDTEGHDHVVLESVFDGGVLPTIICIECGPDTSIDITKLAINNGMRLVRRCHIANGFHDAIFERK